MVQVSDAFLAALYPEGGGGPGARLTALHLGGTRICDVAPLRRATGLLALTFNQEDLDDSLMPVRNCPHVHI